MQVSSLTSSIFVRIPHAENIYKYTNIRNVIKHFACEGIIVGVGFGTRKRKKCGSESYSSRCWNDSSEYI